MDSPVAANVFGTMGAVCWSIQLIPQIIINYRRHNTIGLQPTMMMLWAWAGVPLGAFNIVNDFSIALQIQPQILMLLSFVTWIQCLYYGKHWSLPKSLTLAVPMACIMGGTEYGLIYALRTARERGIEWPITFMAVLAAALLAGGVLRHYWDIYLHRTVRGISFLFVSIDSLGDITSLLSVLFEPRLDILGLVIYGTELVLWLGIFACGGYYNLLPWLTSRFGMGRSSPAVAEESASHLDETQGHGDVMLHDLPSSTSVFRTASGEAAIRARPNASVRPTGNDPELDSV